MRRLLAFVAVATGLALVSCRREPGHDHASEHPAGHDHHQEGHGHDGAPVVDITLWSDAFEVFAEHNAAVVGQPVKVLAHVTVLKDFRPLKEGAVRLELEGPAQLSAEASGPTRPGIYELEVTPAMAGAYRGRFVLGAPSAGSSVEGTTLTVHPTLEAARKAAGEDGHEGLTEFLKEQQWSVPFRTELATAGTLVPSIEVSGTVETPPGGSAEVGAPVAGRVEAPPEGLPRPGAAVKKGQLLALFVPAPSSPEEAVRASLAVTEAEARANGARAALARAERLIKEEALSTKELEDARREVLVAEEALRSARRANALFSGPAKGASGAGWRIVSPIDGVVADVRVNVGTTVAPATPLFRVVDFREIWLKARVPEQEAARLRSDQDAQYRPAGLEDWMPVDVTGPDASASVVSIGRTVDALSRTVEVIYALRRPEPNLRVGGLVQLSLPAGRTFEGVIVPRRAVTDIDGRSVVYVQVDGEHFAERPVRVGAEAGDRVVVTEGLDAGAHIVSEGAHLVRLAARAGSSEPHGHIH